MAKRKRKTPEELQRSRAEGVAKRYNGEQAAKAPLFAWAGLTPTTDADAVLERQLAGETLKFWTEVRQGEVDAAMSFRADGQRFVVWQLVASAVFERVAAWADHVHGPVYCRLHAWRQAAERATAGLDPLPASATVHPTACWESLRRAAAESRWREEKAAHVAAGCTPERCLVANCDRPAPLVLGKAAA